LNGAVVASRKLVDQGIAPRNIQVGQSGKTVSPKLYLALGIHGSMQHLAGLRGAASIIAVNTSPRAPICRISDLVVQGDACEFIEKLMDRIMRNPHTNT
jgi:electron transfer flavoprotein alpha subunit